jgi:hypothetical protein
MTDFSLPAGVYPSTVKWGHVANTKTFTSPLNGSTQTLSFPGHRWTTSLQFANLTRAEYQALYAFIVLLRGQGRRALLSNLLFPTPAGTAAGSPVVDGAGQTGSSLATSGWAHSQTVLKAGDFFSVNGELKLIVSDAVSDSSGNATIWFEPVLRQSPPDATALITSYPTARMKLVSDTFTGDASNGRSFSGSADFEEAFD